MASLFSADTFLGDFLLTYCVFMPTPQLCRTLLQQYPFWLPLPWILEGEPCQQKSFFGVRLPWVDLAKSVITPSMHLRLLQCNGGKG